MLLDLSRKFELRVDSEDLVIGHFLYPIAPLLRWVMLGQDMTHNFNLHRLLLLERNGLGELNEVARANTNNLGVA